MQAAVASVGAALAVVAALWTVTDGGRALTAETARRLAALRDRPAMPARVVQTMTAEPMQLPAQDGKATLLEFVYTTCPTVCQTAGAAMAQLGRQLVSAGLGGSVRLVSLSFDPASDDPPQLARYAAQHGADGQLWTVARPAATDLPALLAAYGVTVIADGWGGWTHNAALHVVAPDGRLHAILDIDDFAGAEAALRQVLPAGAPGRSNPLVQASAVPRLTP